MGSAVLLIHAEQAVRDKAREALELARHAVYDAPELGAAWRLIEVTRPDVIVLPWTVLKSVRDTLARLRDGEVTRQSRVIVWAVQPAIRDAITSLEFGADDCLALPFDSTELVGRVNACLRRQAATVRPDQISAGPVVLDKAVHSVTVDSQPVDLAPTEFRLMTFFLENQGRVFSRDELLRRAWSKNIKAGHRTVDVHVRRLRQLLEPFGCDDMIQTVRGFGYRFASSAGERRVVRSKERLAESDRP
jgi:two-component system phosphate regulon response regulator PhoB